MSQNDIADVSGDALGRQVRLVTIGAVIGAVVLGVSLGVDLAGLADPKVPRVPSLSPHPPTVPMPPTGLPSGFPTGLPTELPPSPPELPSLPALPGGAP